MKNQNRGTEPSVMGMRCEREEGTPRGDGITMRPQIRPLAGPPDDVNNFDLDPDEIRQRAYQIYLKHGGSGGGPDDDWLEAERQLRAERGGGGMGSLAGI